MFTLKHFDRPLIDFDFVWINGPEGKCRILKVYDENRDFLPTIPAIFLNDAFLYSWLRKRVVSMNRTRDDEIWKKLGVSMDDTENLVRKSHVLSLNDCYWASEEGKNELFKDYALHEHISSKNAALAPFFNYDNRRGLRHYKGKLYFYKNDPGEMVTELVAARLAECMGLKFVDYVPASYEGKPCVRCEIFTDTDHSLLTINRILFYHSMKQISGYLEKLGPDFVGAYHDMLVFDSLICNEDRHSGNFGLIVDSRTLKPLEFAPLYDHGRSFFAFEGPKGCEEMLEAAETAENYYGISYNEIAKRFISDRQRSELKAAKGFRMPQKYRKYIPEKRLCDIENFIHHRAEELLTF